VPDFGICSPQPDSFHSQFGGIACRFALHQPRLTYISTRWADGGCSASQPGLNAGVEGDGLNGSLENTPADFAIAPIWNPSIMLSNGTKVEGDKSEPRHLCPGAPVTFTEYNFVGRTQYDFTIPDFRFPSYQPDMGSPTGSMSFGIATH
jgi:hypothetical protein